MIGPASLSPWNAAEVVPTARAAAAPGSQSGSEGDLCRTQGSCCLGGSAGGEQLEVRVEGLGRCVEPVERVFAEALDPHPQPDRQPSRSSPS